MKEFDNKKIEKKIAIGEENTENGKIIKTLNWENVKLKKWLVCGMAYA